MLYVEEDLQGDGDSRVIVQYSAKCCGTDKALTIGTYGKSQSTVSMLYGEQHHVILGSPGPLFVLSKGVLVVARGAEGFRLFLASMCYLPSLPSGAAQ